MTDTPDFVAKAKLINELEATTTSLNNEHLAKLVEYAHDLACQQRYWENYTAPVPKRIKATRVTRQYMGDV